MSGRSCTPGSEALRKGRLPYGMARFCVFLCLALLIADRWLILHQFGFRFTDDDQTIMWNGALEMAQGRFHEPCFYGQRYNSMLEGLVAVPLLWCGVRADVALPLVTSLLTVFPFVLLGAVLYRKRAHTLAAFVLAFPIALSPEFGMITCMPRGFVTGVFLSSFAVMPLYTGRKVWLFFAPFFAVLAVFANPNVAVELLPAGLMIAWQHRMDLRAHGLALAGAVPAVAFYAWSRSFYAQRPTYVVHPDPDLTYDVTDIRWEDLSYLNDVSPFLWGKGGFVFVVLIGGVAWFAWRKHKVESWSLLAATLLIVLSFGIHKIHHGTPNVFFPYSRMFLAVPFLLVVFATQLHVRDTAMALWCMPLLAAGSFAYKCFEQAAAIERQVDPRIDTKVEVTDVAALEDHCARMARIAGAARAEVLVLSWPKFKHMSNYGCPCLQTNFPIALEPALDRRTWLLRDLAVSVRHRVVLTGMGDDHFARLQHVVPPVRRLAGDPLMFLVENDALQMGPLLDSLGVAMRTY